MSRNPSRNPIITLTTHIHHPIPTPATLHPPCIRAPFPARPPPRLPAKDYEDSHSSAHHLLNCTLPYPARHLPTTPQLCFKNHQELTMYMVPLHTSMQGKASMRCVRRKKRTLGCKTVLVVLKATTLEELKKKRELLPLYTLHPGLSRFQIHGLQGTQTHGL